MPSRILPGCSAPGCPVRAVEGGAGKCAKHKIESARSHDEWRGSSSERGYGHAWRKLRAWFMARHPLCEDCELEGRVAAAEHVDHRLAKAKGGTDDPSNLRSLCASCHSKKTATEDGGFGRATAARPPAGGPPG